MVPNAKSGFQNGLVLIVDAETYDYTVSVSNGVGFMLSLMHHVRWSSWPSVVMLIYYETFLVLNLVLSSIATDNIVKE